MVLERDPANGLFGSRRSPWLWCLLWLLEVKSHSVSQLTESIFRRRKEEREEPGGIRSSNEADTVETSSYLKAISS